MVLFNYFCAKFNPNGRPAAPGFRMECSQLLKEADGFWVKAPPRYIMDTFSNAYDLKYATFCYLFFSYAEDRWRFISPKLFLELVI
jgi:hypothetical protein